MKETLAKANSDQADIKSAAKLQTAEYEKKATQGKKSMFFLERNYGFVCNDSFIFYGNMPIEKSYCVIGSMF